MLTRWSIGNFKSFQGNTELQLAPLTIICGANSSGKSSLIQSMLILKQTLQHAPPEKPIALNGPLVRVGGFSDIENRHASRMDGDNHQIKFGCTLNPQPSQYSVPSSHGPLRSIDVSFSIDTKGLRGDKGALEIQPSLQHSALMATYGDADQNQYTAFVSVKRAGRGRKIQFNSTTFEDIDEIFRTAVVAVDKESRAQSTVGLPDARLVGCQLKHFMPIQLMVRYDRVQEAASDISLHLAGKGSPRSGMRRRRWGSIPVTDELRHLLQEALAKHLTLAEPRRDEIFMQLFRDLNQRRLLVIELIDRLKQLPPSTRRSVEKAWSEVADNIGQVVASTLEPDKAVVPSRSDFPRGAADEVEKFFRFSLSYLGPLRDDPKPLYPLQALPSQTDVGPKGELTAAVLHLNQSAKIHFVGPEAIKAEQIAPQPEVSTLRDAVVRWLKYLGVAEDIKTSEQGKFGHELRVQIDRGSDFDDLTNVGVGVSQILPIIVMCLLSERGSSIIIEQPELHLHPAVQARLADFFVCQSLAGRQFLIETHGEHLIERIRRRIAADADDRILPNTKIYFFERRRGRTNCKPIELNRYGAIDNWPADFFDQSQKEAEQIVMSALDKRRREEKK